MLQARPGLRAVRGDHDLWNRSLRRERGVHVRPRAQLRGADSADPDFELAVDPDPNIVCFRYAPSGRHDLDALQARIRQKIVGEGSFYLVQTRLPAGLFLRTTLINPFTSESDLRDLLREIRNA